MQGYIAEALQLVPINCQQPFLKVIPVNYLAVEMLYSYSRYKFQQANVRKIGL